MKRTTLALWALLILATTTQATPKTTAIKGRDKLGRDYYLYLPKPFDDHRTYRLVVGVHGYRQNAKGAAGIARWVSRGDCIVVAPQFPQEGYQYLALRSGEQLVKLIAQLKTEYHLYDKAFLWGHSGGAQFVHRFAMKHPELVAGCSAHAAGTWLTGDYPPASQDVQPSAQANSVIFAIHCGLLDTRKSFRQAPLGRLAWARKFAGQLCDKGFIFKEMYHPGMAHHVRNTAWALTEECYFLSTMGMDKSEAARVFRTESSVLKAIAAKRASSAKRGIATLRKLADTKPKPLAKMAKPSNAPDRTGKSKLDASGWYFPAEREDVFAEIRRAYLTDLTDRLEAQLNGKPATQSSAPASASSKTTGSQPAPTEKTPQQSNPHSRAHPPGTRNGQPARPKSQLAPTTGPKCGTKAAANNFYLNRDNKL